MATSTHEDPISLLMASHRRTRLLLNDLLASSHAGQVRAAHKDLIEWFDNMASKQRHIIENNLSPALIESMAGSDAVCIQGITRGFTNNSADLDKGWRQNIRPALEKGHVQAPELEDWVARYQDLLDCADQELLPMADRLLDSLAMQSLLQACAGLTDADH